MGERERFGECEGISKRNFKERIEAEVRWQKGLNKVWRVKIKSEE